jgi:hypothetical protein
VPLIDIQQRDSVGPDSDDLEFLSQPVRTERDPPRTRLPAVAVVNPRIVRTVPPPIVLPLRPAALRRRLLAALRLRCRDHAAQPCRRLRRLARHCVLPAGRAATRAERSPVKDRLVHLLRAAAATAASRGDDSRLNAMWHQRLNQSLLPRSTSCSSGAATGRGSGSSPGARGSIASIWSACLFNRNRPAISDCNAA